MEVTKTEVAEVLEEAAEVVRRGWVQDNYRGETADGKVGHCLLGGIRCATGYMWTPHRDAYGVCHSRTRLTKVAYGWLAPSAHLQEVADVAADVVSAKLGGICVDSWNDKPGRTQEEVVEILLQTAKDLRNTA